MTKRPACDDAPESPRPLKKGRLDEPTNRGITTAVPRQPGHAIERRERSLGALDIAYLEPAEIRERLKRRRETDFTTDHHHHDNTQPRPSKMARTGHKPDYGKLYTPEEELLARRREPASDDPNGVRYWPADIMRRGPQGWFPDPYQVEIILRLEQGLMPTKREQHIWDEQEEYRRWRLAKPHARFRTPSPDGDDEGQRVGYMSIPIGATPDADENGVTPNMLWMHDESEERIAEVFGQEYARWWFNRQKEITIDSEREWREWRAKQAATAQASGPATVQTPQQTAVQTPEPATIQTIEPAIILTPESTTTQTSGPVPPAKRGKSARQPKKKTQKKKREAQKGKETRRVNKNVQQDDKQNVPEMTTARRLTRQSRARTATTTVFYELDQRGKIRST